MRPAHSTGRKRPRQWAKAEIMKSNTLSGSSKQPPTAFRWFGAVLVMTAALGVAALSYVVVIPLIHP